MNETVTCIIFLVAGVAATVLLAWALKVSMFNLIALVLPEHAKHERLAVTFTAWTLGSYLALVLGALWTIASR